MTSDLPPTLSFDALRAEAIPAAQHASGDIWTDFNIHDPGVTLLEQTCFALTEIAYRGDHAVRDLLTQSDGSFDPHALALSGPQEVLPSRPVTVRDLAAGLSTSKMVERVFVHRAAVRGLFDISVIPGPGHSDEEAISTVTDAFAQVRMIGTDAGRITVARQHPLILAGRIEINAFAKPDAIAAEIYHRINLALHGFEDDGTGGRTGATRDDVFDDPATIWTPVSAEPGNPSRIDLVLSALRRIDGVETVQELALTSTETGRHVPFNTRHGVVYEVGLPGSDQAIPLELSLNGNPVPLDPDRIAEEYDRVVAARIARQGNRLDLHDFDVLAPGRPRPVPAVIDVDATLPAIYRYRGLEKAKPYRTTISRHLGTVAAPLSDLPDRYAAQRPVDWTNPADIRQRIEMLDYLIALQGEEMPATSQSGLNHYQSPAARTRWQVAWRETYLAQLPLFNLHQGTAHPEFGVLARLAHLIDLKPVQAAKLTDAGVTLDPDAKLPDPTVERNSLLLPYRATDMLLDRDAEAEPFSSEMLPKFSPWLSDMVTTPELYRRAANPDAYFLARDRNSDWQLLFEPHDGASSLYGCGSGRDRADMVARGNRLCNSWQALNRDCETVALIEDIELRSGMTDFRHASVTALLTGWTARTTRPAFRRYVQDMILRVAPAHVHIRPLWLSQEAVHVLTPLLQAWREGEDGAGGALRMAMNAIYDETAS